MNCNLVIANDYGGLSEDIKKLSKKSRLLFTKRAAYQFDLSSVELALPFRGIEKIDKLNLLSYQENVDLFNWKYTFYVSGNQLKDCKIFSPYTQFKNKGLEFEDTKKQKNIVCMNWKRYLFKFDSHYRDQTLIFVYDQKRNKFLTNEVFLKIANIVNDDYLRYGKNININDIFHEWAAKLDNNKLVIGNLFDYQKLNLDKKILMSLVQFNNGLFICSGIELYTCVKELRPTTDSMLERCQNIGRADLMTQQLTQLRNDFKSLV